MPIRKFRSIEEMKQPAWLPSGDPAIPRQIRYLWRVASAFARRVPPRGVRKYRSVEAADDDRRTWEMGAD
jgi:hypothetical protein